MGKIMETPDGLNHFINDERDVIDLIRDYAGVDAADYMEGLLEELREEIECSEDAVQDLEEAYGLINNGETKAELYLYLRTIEGCKVRIAEELDQLNSALGKLEKLTDKVTLSLR